MFYQLKPKARYTILDLDFNPNGIYQKVKLDCVKHKLDPCPDYETEKCCGCGFAVWEAET